MSAPPTVVEVLRGGIVESRHRGHAVVVDRAGTVIGQVGNPQTIVFPRSTMKPLQAVGMLELGVGLRGADVAIMAASHSGEDDHIERVSGLLSAIGLAEDDLQCPPDLPYDEEVRRVYLAAGRVPTRLTMNCSGKHAAMLRTCVRNGWSTADYLDPAHPLQRALLQTVERLTRCTVEHATTDGCGAPLWAVPLTGMARAIAVMLAASAGTPECAVVEAFRSYPEVTAGRHRDVSALMRGVPGLIAKDGAEAVQVMGLPDGLAVALKVEDGSSRARPVFAAGLLAALGVDRTVVHEQSSSPVLGGGRPVGEVRPAQAVRQAFAQV